MKLLIISEKSEKLIYLLTSSSIIRIPAFFKAFRDSSETMAKTSSWKSILFKYQIITLTILIIWFCNIKCYILAFLKILISEFLTLYEYVICFFLPHSLLQYNNTWYFKNILMTYICILAAITKINELNIYVLLNNKY